MKQMPDPLSEANFKRCFGDLPEAQQERLRLQLYVIEKVIGLQHY
jgi:hypothetical protein